MRKLHAIFTLILLVSIGLFAFDVMYHWAVYKEFKVITVEQLWTEISKTNFVNASSYAETVVSPETWELFIKSPAQVVLLIIAGILSVPLLVAKVVTPKEEEEDYY